MANLNSQKYHKYIIPNLNVELKRFYVGDTPDTVGTIEFWCEDIWELYNQMPFPDLWGGIQIEIWDMKSPDLISNTNSTLLDYDIHQPGNQTAAGLYFNGDSKRIAIGVWTDKVWDPSLTTFEWSQNVLSHEFGHLYSNLCGVLEGRQDFHKMLTEFFENNRPRQTEAITEDFAETYRAILGADQTRGTFSDKKEYKAPNSMRTYMRVLYKLSKILENQGTISDIKFNDTWCQWTRVVTKTRYISSNKQWWEFWKPDGYYIEEKVQEFYALTDQWDLFVWKDSKWTKI